MSFVIFNTGETTMVWVIYKPSGEFYRTADGLPLYFGSKYEAKKFAEARNIKHYSLMPVRD